MKYTSVRMAGILSHARNRGEALVLIGANGYEHRVDSVALADAKAVVYGGNRIPYEDIQNHTFKPIEGMTQDASDTDEGYSKYNLRGGSYTPVGSSKQDASDTQTKTAGISIETLFKRDSLSDSDVVYIVQNTPPSEMPQVLKRLDAAVYPKTVSEILMASPYFSGSKTDADDTLTDRESLRAKLRAKIEGNSKRKG